MIAFFHFFRKFATNWSIKVFVKIITEAFAIANKKAISFFIVEFFVDPPDKIIKIWIFRRNFLFFQYWLPVFWLIPSLIGRTIIPASFEAIMSRQPYYWILFLHRPNNLLMFILGLNDCVLMVADKAWYLFFAKRCLEGANCNYF
jgi:hypothetical protein